MTRETFTMNSLITRSHTILTACPRAGILLTGALFSIRARQRTLRSIRFTSQLNHPDPFQALISSSDPPGPKKETRSRGGSAKEQREGRQQHQKHRLRSGPRSQAQKKQPGKRPEHLLTLAIETSCDDTCVAVLEKKAGAARLLFNKIITSNSSRYQGIHPVVAIQSHEQNLTALIEEAKKKLPFNTNGERRVPDFISVTRGPGMNGGLRIGIDKAKELASSWGIPILGIHHMQAHALTPRLVDALSRPFPDPTMKDSVGKKPLPVYPFLTLLVSGGHTQLVLSTSLTSHTVVVNTQDISIGDMLDKCARSILPKNILENLGTGSYGAALEKFAFPDAETNSLYDYEGYKPPRQRVDEVTSWVSEERGWIVAPPLAKTRALEYNFTSLGGVIRQYAATLSQYDFSGRQTLARVVMKLAFEHVVGRILLFFQEYRVTKDGAAGKGKVAPWSPQTVLSRQEGQQERKRDQPSVKTTATTTKIDRTENDNRIKLILSGGVASNKYLRHILRNWLNARGYSSIVAVAPPPEFCTDNAAMIAWTGMEMFEAGYRTPLDDSLKPTRRWSLDPSVTPPKIGTLARDEYGVGLMEQGFFEQVSTTETSRSNRKSFEEFYEEFLASDGK